MIAVLFWFLSIHLLLGVVRQMSNKTSVSLPVSIVSIVGKLRPDAATGYRLVDSQNRLFPPSDQNAYNVRTRIEPPDVPAGTYGIRFEDAEGNLLSYSKDGTLAEVELDGATLTQTPDQIAVHSEREWQDLEKRELRIKAKHIRNEGLQGIVGMLHNAHGLVFESHREVKESQKYVAEMMRNFMELQRGMMDQQKALNAQAQAAVPPPPPENWASATPKILRELGDVVKVAVMATTAERSPRGSILEALAKPMAALEALSAASAETPANPSAAKSSATVKEDDPSSSTPPAAAPPPVPPPPAPPVSPPPAAPPSTPPADTSPATPLASPSPSAAPPIAPPPAAPPPPPAPPPPAAPPPLASPPPPAAPPVAPPPAAPPPAASSSAPPSALSAAAPGPQAPPSAALRLIAPASVGSSSASPALHKDSPPAAAPAGNALVALSGKLPRPVPNPEGQKSRSRAAPASQIPPPTQAEALRENPRRLLWRLRCLMAQGIWKEMKRRIIHLPDSTLHLVVSNRDTFLSWLQWIAEPAQLLRSGL